MTDYITIRSGDFAATLDLREIHRIPTPQWRKLLKLAVRQIWDNAGNLLLAMDWLEEVGIPGAKARQAEAEKDAETDTRPTRGLRADQREAARQHNAWLKSRLAEARARVRQLEKLRATISETVPTDQLEYWLTN